MITGVKHSKELTFADRSRDSILPLHDVSSTCSVMEPDIYQHTHWFTECSCSCKTESI